VASRDAVGDARLALGRPHCREGAHAAGPTLLIRMSPISNHWTRTRSSMATLAPRSRA